MTVHIVSEEAYRKNTWCERIINGILERAKRKKIKTAFQTGNLSTGQDDSIVVIGTSPT